jgi:bifunctional non-homologous end joining protein LigD
MLQRALPAGFISPCLPTKATTLPSGRLWLHEIKHDGFRVIARKDGEPLARATHPRSGEEGSEHLNIIAAIMALAVLRPMRRQTMSRG